MVDALAEDGCAGVVVLHGTDTMEESALYVDLFHDDARAVVFTGPNAPPIIRTRTAPPTSPQR